MNESTELALVPPAETALAVFTSPRGLEPWLQKIRAEIDSFLPDLSSRSGREAIASVAHRVARSKTALDNAGKTLVAEHKEIPKKIDAERKRVRDTLDAWRDEVRAPLNEWEAREAARVAGHEEVLSWLSGLVAVGQDVSVEQLRQQLGEVEALEVSAALEEFEMETGIRKAAALTTLANRIVERIKADADQAELAQHRAEQAAREQVERDQRIALEATARAKQAAERREVELKQQAAQSAQREADAIQRAERAERDAIERAELAAQAERQRQADQQAVIQREAAAREADKEHRLTVLRGIKNAVMQAGVSEEQAHTITNLIRKGEVPHVSVSY